MENKQFNGRRPRHVGKQGQEPHTPGQEELMAAEALNQAKRPSEAAMRAADMAIERQRQKEGVNTGAKWEKETLEFDAETPSTNKKKKTKKENGGGKKGKTRRIILFCLLAVLLIGGGILIKFYMDISANRAALFAAAEPTVAPAGTLTPNPTPETTLPPDATPTPIPTIDPEAQLLSEADLEFMKNRVNILVLGIDESTERSHWGSFRTDTMILTTIDFETNDVTMISLPRDSYVKLANAEAHLLKSPDGSPVFGKINSAFSAGGGAKSNGYGYAMGTASYILGGVPVQYYVGFNMNVVKDIVNAMGGLEYNVDIEVKMNGREYSPGWQHMDGQAVLDYCRMRKGSSDIARVERQQNMLKAIFSEMKQKKQLTKIPDIYKAVEQNIETNLSFKQICSLALLAVDMDFSQLQSRTLDGSFLNVKSISYWGLYTNQVAAMVKEVFGVSVSVDGDMNVTNIRAQIEAARQLIAAELNAAKSALNTADTLLNSYGGYLTEDAKTRLKAARSQCEDAYEAEDKALLDYYTPQLVQINNELIQSLQQAGIAVGAQQQPVQQAPAITPEIPVVEVPEYGAPAG